MKRLAVLLFAASSLCLLGCPEEKAVPEPVKATVAPTSTQPGAAPTATVKAKTEEPGGW